MASLAGVEKEPATSRSQGFNQIIFLMKKHFVLLAASVAAVLCACSHENALTANENPVLDPETTCTREITISAYSGDAGRTTKTSRDENGTFFWSPKDQISLFYGSGTDGGWKFTSTNYEPAEQADFTGTIDIITGAFEGAGSKMFWGVYPYSEETKCDGDVLTTRVLAEQVAVPGTFADGQFVSIARSEGLSLAFYNLCGGIKFTIDRTGVSQITLRGNNYEPLAGLVDIIFDENHHPVVSEYREVYDSIILTCQDGEFIPGQEYFFVTLPVTFEAGFTVEFSDGFRRVIESSLTINRSKFQWSDYPLDYDGGDYVSFEYPVLDDETLRYLADVEYDSDYSVSYVKDFAGTDSPLPLSIQCEGASYVQLSTTASFMDYKKYDMSSGSADIYNLIPGVRYYFKVMDGSDNVLQQGTATPVGPVRWIHGVVGNMRDLGGWTASGIDVVGNPYKGAVKYGKIYRGRQLDGISSEGMDIFLNELGISVDLDLRGYDTGNPGSVLPSEQCQWHNIRLQQFLGDGTGNTEELYRDAIRQIILWLDEGRNIYFHCIGGADRTGTLAFLIEALLGVSESDLSKEYELTTFSKQTRLRSDTDSRPFRLFIDYLNNRYSSGSGGTVQETVMNWAMNGENALSADEIKHLQDLMLDYN